MTETKHFGRKMRERRESLNISLRELGDMINMSETALRSIEFGDSDPKLTTVLKIGNALKMDMGMLNSCIPVLI